MKTYSHLDTQTTKTSKQNATERASSSVKNEVQERKLEKRTMEKNETRAHSNTGKRGRND